MYSDFLKFLGTRTSGTLRKSRRKLDKEASIEYYVHSTYEEVDLYFASTTVISEVRDLKVTEIRYHYIDKETQFTEERNFVSFCRSFFL
jgi:hypothetical protein